MEKPVFWNSIALYLLLYNNSLLIISLVIALLAVINGTSAFTASVWYQILVFVSYIVMIFGLLSGGKRGYWLAALFIPFIFIQYFYPPMMLDYLPTPILLAFRLIELASMLFILLAPSSRRYVKEHHKS